MIHEISTDVVEVIVENSNEFSVLNQQLVPKNPCQTSFSRRCKTRTPPCSSGWLSSHFLAMGAGSSTEAAASSHAPPAEAPAPNPQKARTGHSSKPKAKTQSQEPSSENTTPPEAAGENHAKVAQTSHQANVDPELDLEGLKDVLGDKVKISTV